MIELESLEFHPLADCIPLMKKEEIAELAKSIKAIGLINKIVLYEGKILDGRCRYLACKLAGVKPEFTEYTGDDPRGFLVSMNILRAHYTETQKAIMTIELQEYLEAHPEEWEAFKEAIAKYKLYDQIFKTGQLDLFENS